MAGILGFIGAPIDALLLINVVMHLWLGWNIMPWLLWTFAAKTIFLLFLKYGTIIFK